MAVDERRATAGPVGHRLVNTLHQGIPVRDLEASTRFYTEVLGLPILPRPYFPRPGVWLGYPGGEVEIHLTLVDDAPQHAAPPGPGNRHTAFGVTDLQALQARLEALAVPFHVQTGFIQSDQVFVNDPDGNTLEFQQV